MWRWFVRVLASALILGCCAAPALAKHGAYDRYETEEDDTRPPGFQYGLTVLFAVVTLIIVCMPSRKGTE